MWLRYNAVVTTPNRHILSYGTYYTWLSQYSLRPIWLLYALICLLGGCVSSPLYPRTLHSAECPLPVPEELEEGHTIACGYLHVPQNRALPDGLQVKLPYARIRAESAHPHPDPLVYVVGGPGGSALAEFNQIYPWFRTLRRDRDLILYDQRGTLLADPVLECTPNGTPPTSTEIEQVSARVPAYLHPLDANDATIARCADELQAQGIDLAHNDTATHARDGLQRIQSLWHFLWDAHRAGSDALGPTGRARGCAGLYLSAHGQRL